MIAPTISYGVTTSLSAFPGTFRISPEVFKAYCKEVLTGLSGIGFRNIIVHGYLDLDLNRVARFLGEDLNDFEVFAQHIEGWLER